jgi:D-sedoheptulose 7-phosphate isomerase
VPDWLSAQLRTHLETASALEAVLPEVRSTGRMLCAAFTEGHIVYTLGNGGSAADAQHLTGELIGHYKRKRRALAAVTLSADPSTLTCIANDFSFDDVFSRQVKGLARRGDVVAAFTTSGNSENVVSALRAAKEIGARTVLFGGASGGRAVEFADHPLLVPSTETPRIQEMHTFMLHAISEMVDAWAAGEEGYE